MITLENYVFSDKDSYFLSKLIGTFLKNKFCLGLVVRKVPMSENQKIMVTQQARKNT